MEILTQSLSFQILDLINCFSNRISKHHCRFVVGGWLWQGKLVDLERGTDCLVDIASESVRGAARGIEEIECSVLFNGTNIAELVCTM